MNTEQPEHHDIHQRILQAWNHYQKADQARTEASAAVTAELAAGREAGVSMYRMAKWLGVHNRTIQARLEYYDQPQNSP